MTKTNKVGLVGLAGMLTAMGTAPAQTASEAVLHNFGRWQGAKLYGGVVRDAAGNLYGTADTGGPSYDGVVFKVDPAGQYTELYGFTGGTGGTSNPNGVVLDSAGNLYGTAGGGARNAGVIYELDTAGHFTVLYSFKGGAQGADPNGVIRDSAGNFYGTTASGGNGSNCVLNGCGVLFKLDSAGHYSVLHQFTGSDGVNPTAGVIRDPAGNLYGTTEYGGAHVQGTVYELDAAGRYTVLYNFTGKADGGGPFAGVVRDPAGNLYGTTRSGGAGNDGVIYRVDTAGRETVLYSFTDGDNGSLPDAGVTLDPAGNLYGTRPYTSSASGGDVYELDTAGNYTVLYGFTGADGSEPLAGVILDPAGNLYGTTYYGGPTSGGVVYKLDTAGHETVLHSFPNGRFGSFPSAGLTRDTAGNLYGSASEGGTTAYGGVVYRLDAAGAYTVLHSFTGTDGSEPNGVTLDAAGNLYGTTTLGGAVTGSCTGGSYPDGCGVVYKLDATGQETVLHSFTGGADGALPFAGAILDPAGNLYGTATGGGAWGHGVVYKVDTAGNYTVLYSFEGGADGAGPNAVIRDAAGNLYGTVCCGGIANQGLVYKLDAAVNYTVLYSFTGGAVDGATPISGVVRDAAGNLYGTTLLGGAADLGVVYKLDAAGQETVLYIFTGEANGGAPYAGVTLDPAGNLYGTASNIGTGGGGLVYELDTAGNYSVLYAFAYGDDGYEPRAGLLRDQAGALYGTTYEGGTRNTGVIFKITPP